MARYQHSRLTADARRRLRRLEEQDTHRRAVLELGGPGEIGRPTAAQDLALAREWIRSLTDHDLAELAIRLGSSDEPTLVAEWRRLGRPTHRATCRA